MGGDSSVDLIERVNTLLDASIYKSLSPGERLACHDLRGLEEILAGGQLGDKIIALAKATDAIEKLTKSSLADQNDCPGKSWMRTLYDARYSLRATLELHVRLANENQ